MDKVQLKASVRDLKKDKVKKLAAKGMVPCELYGRGVPNSHLAVNLGEFEKVLRKAGESTIVDLETEDGKKHNVLIHEVQRHYLTSRPVHVDFYQVNMSEKLKARVPLEFVGVSPAVKNLGGTLVRVLGEVEVESLPGDLPHSLTADISVLNTFQDTLHIKDIQVPASVKIVAAGEELVAKIQAPRNVEEELAAPVDEKAAVEAAVAASEKPKAEEDGEAKEEKEKK